MTDRNYIQEKWKKTQMGEQSDSSEEETIGIGTGKKGKKPSSAKKKDSSAGKVKVSDLKGSAA